MPRARVAENIELHYETHGSGCPVIFINGLTTTLESWNYQIKPFSSRYRVIVYDFRGQGRSDKPETGYSCDLHTADLKVLMEHLEIKRAHIIGLSFGAFVAMNFAALHPENTGALAVSDTTSEAYPLIYHILSGWTDAQNCGGLELRFEVSLPWLYSEGFIQKNRRKIKIFKEAFKRLDGRSMEKLTVENLQNTVTDKLPLILAPTLLLVGEQDILTPLRYTLKLKEKISQSEISVIEECGHVAPIEKPEQFNRIVLDFLQRHDHLCDVGECP